WAALGLVFNTRLSAMMAQALAPTGALFAFLCVSTGSFWCKPMWGTWWTWDPRLTSELVLLFLYLGVIGLNAAIEDRRAAARAAGFLALIGVVNVPIVHFSVEWWNTLHQGATIKLMGESSIDASMVLPLVLITIGTKLWFMGSLLRRTQLQMLAMESGKDWVRRVAKELGA
ncbi:MAG: cytochrome c biogenesis protein CcsA, partial [Xanthomonadales bacterium]|nr:cytochrome c biogenesis protein CcsA [Xanthomonadales bacterium]